MGKKKETIVEALYSMELFDKIRIDPRRTIIRVPGGWVMESFINFEQAGPQRIASSFIPFNNEFAEH